MHKVSEIRALRKKGLSEDEIAKRLTLAGRSVRDYTRTTGQERQAIRDVVQLRPQACRRTRYFAISNIVGWVSSVLPRTSTSNSQTTNSRSVRCAG